MLKLAMCCLLRLLSAEISTDQLNFTARGYALLAARLEPELDRLLAPNTRTFQSVAAGSTNSFAIRSSRATIYRSVPGLPDNRAISSTPASR